MSVVDIVSRGRMDAHFGLSKQFLGQPKKHTEYISPRDYGQVPGSVA